MDSDIYSNNLSREHQKIIAQTDISLVGGEGERKRTQGVCFPPRLFAFPFSLEPNY
ncbi:hypothetical protein FDUTEX481_07392 [Tolypothrix sp. PCC 7601]|nr:hypothetical protein FDUTEX481_07392 [Tolypothrix sp. PCC 7601]